MSSAQWIALLAVVVAALALVVTTVLAVALRRVRSEVRGLTEAPRDTAATPRTERATDTAATPRTERATDTAATPRTGRGAGISPTPPAEAVPSQELDVVATTPLPDTRASGERGEIVTREGRVVVVPSTQQVVEATLGKPMIRGAVLSHGLRYALRPESRDRLRGMVRREYRRRRRVRLRAGRRAARAATIPPRDPQSWLSTSATRRLNVEDDGGS